MLFSDQIKHKNIKWLYTQTSINIIKPLQMRLLVLLKHVEVIGVIGPISIKHIKPC